jgi:hypothetical protein
MTKSKEHAVTSIMLCASRQNEGVPESFSDFEKPICEIVKSFFRRAYADAGHIPARSELLNLGCTALAPRALTGRLDRPITRPVGSDNSVI